MNVVKYIVITGDVINSRNSKFNKEEFVTKIKKMNTDYKNEIVIGFSILKGDEIQGILRYGCNLFKIIRMLEYYLKPYKLRIGVGIGDIDGDIIDCQTSWELNGEAFFLARDAIDEISNRRKKNVDYKVLIHTNNQEKDEKINLFYSFVNKTISKWNDDIWLITMNLESGFTHEEIAEVLLKKKNKNTIRKEEIQSERSNVTKKIKRSDWYSIVLAEKYLLEMLYGGEEKNI